MLTTFEAREFVHKLELKSIKEWQKYIESDIPSNIPKKPREIYKEQGWISILDWLGIL
jgi:hypothetical protein